MRVIRGAMFTIVAALLLAVALPAQEGGVSLGQSRYESMYGAPVDVSLSDLAQMPEAYSGRAIRTKGRLDIDSQSAGQRVFVLSETLAAQVLLIPSADIAGSFDMEAMRLLGREVEITGLFQASSMDTLQTGSRRVGTIEFWQYVGPPPEIKGPIHALDITLESLVLQPAKRDGQTVRVVGQFRGRNLFGDLPARSQRSSSDWVMKDDLFAVWVTGRKPKGSGWALDAELKRDTGKWIEVVGRPLTRSGVTYIQALQVRLTTPPTPTAQAQAPPPPPERPKVPPVVVFALPLDGEKEIPPDSRFVIQFSKDMNESGFEGHVLLRYVGPAQPGDRPFDGLKLTYDGGRRALTVDPGDRLIPGRRVELVLLPGITDMDGLTLIPRSGQPMTEVVDVLRYEVGT